MIFYYNSRGTLINSSIEKVYQGSDKANIIYFVAPFAPSATVTAKFILANKQITGINLLKLDTLDGITDTENNGFTVWSTDICKNITAYAGKVTVQFEVFLTSSDNEKATIVATEGVNFNIEEGVLPLLPEEPTDDVYAQILAALSYSLGYLTEKRKESETESLSAEEDGVSYSESEKLIFKNVNGESSKNIRTEKKLPLSFGDNLSCTLNDKENCLLIDVKNEVLDKKLDKALAPSDADCLSLYGVDFSGRQITQNATRLPTENTVPVRTEGGYAFVNTPQAGNTDLINDKHIINYLWVDTYKSLYQHTVYYTMGDSAGHCAYLECRTYLTTSEPIQTESEFLSHSYELVNGSNREGWWQMIFCNQIDVDKSSGYINVYSNFAGGDGSNAYRMLDYEFCDSESEEARIYDVVKRVI